MRGGTDTGRRNARPSIVGITRASEMFRRWVETQRVAGKTNTQLASDLGISGPTFYEYIKGVSTPQSRPRKAMEKTAGIRSDLPW
jgi:hypothetical protein